MSGPYTVPMFIDRIKAIKPRVIVECGARDCEDSLDLADTYKPDVVYAFECNQTSLVNCRRIANADNNVILVERGVWDTNGRQRFRPMVCNIGASSFFKQVYSTEIRQGEEYVDVVRLDSFMAHNEIERIDLLCLDIQGAELKALEGLGERIDDVGAIVIEMSRKAYYEGAPLYDEVHNWLCDKGFVQTAYDGSPEAFFNALYERQA